MGSPAPATLENYRFHPALTRCSSTRLRTSVVVSAMAASVVVGPSTLRDGMAGAAFHVAFRLAPRRARLRARSPFPSVIVGASVLFTYLVRCRLPSYKHDSGFC